MKLDVKKQETRAEAGFTLIEVMMGVLIMGTLMVSLYAGFSYSFSVTRLTRENARATQILQDKMEVMRLINWDQLVNSPGYVPSTFTAAYFDASPSDPSTAKGITYTGTVLVTNVLTSETYSNDVRKVQITLRWTSGNMTHTRRMTTCVSQYGMQNYIY